jgi:LAO/AO transport system kinase
LLEIADIFVVNKADRPGVEEARRDLEHMLDLASLADDGWRPRIVSTVASTGSGVDDVVEAIASHRSWLSGGGRLEAKRSARLCDELIGILSERVVERVRGLRAGEDFARVQATVAAREVDPWTAADELLARLP